MIELSFELLKKALFQIEENTYQNLCILENSHTNPMAVYRFDMVDIAKYEYKKNYNKRADYISFDNEHYMKFSFPININTPEDREDKRKKKATDKPYVTLQERGKQNRPSLELYIDRLKVPDSDVLLTMYEGGLDLYVPKKYFTKQGANLNLVLNKYTVQDQYLNTVVKNSKQSQIMIDSNTPINEDTLKVFKNGKKLMKGYDYSAVTVGNRGIVSLYMLPKSTDVLEVLGSNFCEFTAEYPNCQDSLISFPEDVLDTLTISNELIEVYKNGQRLFPQDIVPVTARHFKVSGFTKGDDISVRLSYNPIAMTKDNEYLDDILYYFRFADRDTAIKVLIEGNTDGSPEFIKKMAFPPDYIPVRDINPAKQGKTYPDYVVDAIKSYININSNNLRYFLKYFAGLDDQIFIVKNKKNITRMDTFSEMGEFKRIRFNKPKVVFSLKVKLGDFDILSFVNDVKILKNEVNHYTHMGTTYIYLDADRVEDNDVIRFRVVPVYNRELGKKFININAGNFTNDTFRVEKKLMGVIKNHKDIRLMKRKDDGFQFLKVGTDYTIENEKDTIKFVISERKLGDLFIAYNTSIYDYKVSKFNPDNLPEVNSITIDSYSDDYKLWMPRLTDYSVSVFAGGKMLIEGLDFFISGQDKHPDINRTKVVFRNLPKAGSDVEIYNIEQLRKQLGAVESIDSELGIIYLKKLPFPFSLDYLDLYVNGIRMGKNDVQIISDKMIRIINPNLKRPYFDVAIIAKLDFPLDSFDEFLEQYQKNPSAWDDYLKNKYLPDLHDDDDISIAPVFEEDYKNKYPDVVPVPVDPEYIPPSRIDPLLNLIAMSLYSGLIPRKMDANERLGFLNSVEFSQFLSNKHNDSPTIKLDSNDELINVSASIDCEGTLRTVQDVLDIIGKQFGEGKIDMVIDFNDPFPNFDQLEVSKYLYLEEMSLPNTGLDGPFVFDANSDDEDDEE